MDRLWAPWRIEYVRGNAPRHQGCFFCHAWRAEGEEAEHLVLVRRAGAFVIMNRYPYAGGHLMVAPARHIGPMEETTAEEAASLWSLAVLCQQVLSEAMHPDGYNVGVNQGRCAGAGVVDHLHLHIVPRWEGDHNFMPVLDQTRVLSQALEEAYGELLPLFRAREEA